MSDKLNPYQSPAAHDDHQSWWAKLRSLFRTTPVTSAFSSGSAVICDGISFFVDPQNPAVAYAASPSAEYSERRMNLIISEVVRVLPFFLADYPELHTCLRGRKLAVRMIDKYTDDQSTFRHEVLLNWDILDALLADALDADSDEHV